MMPEQADLLEQERESLAAAKLLCGQGYHSFAASRTYFSIKTLTRVSFSGR
jgi:hypothetical protein